MQCLLFGLGSVLVVEEVCLEYVQRVDVGVLTTEALMEPVTVHEVVAIAYGRGEVGSPLVLGLQQREETLRKAVIIDCPYSEEIPERSYVWQALAVCLILEQIHVPCAPSSVASISSSGTISSPQYLRELNRIRLIGEEKNFEHVAGFLDHRDAIGVDRVGSVLALPVVQSVVIVRARAPRGRTIYWKISNQSTIVNCCNSHDVSARTNVTGQGADSITF